MELRRSIVAVPFKMGLQTKIILLVVCGLTAIFASFTFLGMQMLNESTQQSLDERMDMAKIVAAYTDEQIAGAMEMLGAEAEPGIIDLNRSDADSRRDELGKLRDRSTFFSYGVFVLDTSGHVVWATPPEHFPAGSLAPGYDSLLAGADSSQPRISDLVTDPATSTNLVLLATPVLDNDKIIGLVGGASDVATGSLSTLLKPVAMGQSSYAEILDHSGRVIAGTRSDRLLTRDDHADRFFSLIRDQQPMVGRCYRCHESLSDARQNDVLAFAPLMRAPWGVALRELEADVLAPTREMTKRILLVAIPLFAGALFVAWITTRRVVRRIRELTLASERIALGDLNSVVEASGTDELGVLATAFDSMRDKLKTSHEEIETLNRGLEERVERRTRDLYTIFETSQIAASTVDVDKLLGEIVARLVTVIRPADAGALYLSNEENLLAPCCEHGYSTKVFEKMVLSPGEGIAGQVFATGKAMLWTDQGEIAAMMTNLSPSNAAYWKEASAGLPLATSTIGVPLMAQSRAIGCLVLDSFQRDQAFTDFDLSLVQTIADRVAVAIENARLYEEVQRKEQLRGQLLEKLIVAQEDERRRIARELHDETGQSLTALAISLASAQERLPAKANGAAEAIEQSKQLADKLLAEIRRLISDLRPTVLDDLGLVPALRRYASTHAPLVQIDIQFHVEGKRRRLSAQAETALYRMVQEAITNVVKHASAKGVVITLAFEERRVVVTVADDGCGFDVAQTLSASGPKRGMGLLGMRERVSILGGTLSVESQQSGAGTTLTISLPLEREEPSVYGTANQSSDS
jgi:signal transduction histidine kinase